MEYATRIHTTVLPNFPEEVLIEWFHRHPLVIKKHLFLEFDSLHFEQQLWSLDDLPGREAFESEHDHRHLVSVFDQMFKADNFVARYMSDHGTWNTPILLMKNLSGKLRWPSGETFNHPYHLLEGHKRLAFLSVLRRSGKALKEHQVWIIDRPDSKSEGSLRTLTS
jgi:hypothetical protein